MKFPLDVCAASRTLRKALTDDGHNVLSAADGFAHASDEDLLALAFEQNRVLVTKDKDFGKLVFVRRLPHPCIIRLAGLSATEQSRAMRDLIEDERSAIREGAIIVVTGGRVRIRSARGIERNND